jgi:hypothetical protein
MKKKTKLKKISSKKDVYAYPECLSHANETTLDMPVNMQGRQ